jgi:hypothetical protein
MLRASNAASLLTKEALIGRALRLGGRVADASLRGVGGFIRKHPVASVAAAGAIGTSVPVVSEGFRSGARGVSPDYARAQRMGYAEDPKAPYPYSY